MIGFFIVNGSGCHKEHYKLSGFEIDIESTSLMTVSSLFRKGKEKCESWWEKVERLKVCLKNKKNKKMGINWWTI